MLSCIHIYVYVSEGIGHKGRKVAMMGGSFKKAGKASRIYVTRNQKGNTSMGGYR